MDWLARLQVLVGVIWLVLGLGIAVWMVAPSQRLIDLIWWGFAFGCALTGVWMGIEPFLRGAAAGGRRISEEAARLAKRGQGR